MSEKFWEMKELTELSREEVESIETLEKLVEALLSNERLNKLSDWEHALAAVVSMRLRLMGYAIIPTSESKFARVK